MAPSQFGLFAESKRSGGTPDLQFHIQPLSLDDLSNPQSMHRFPGLTTSVCNLRPTSRGSVTPTSSDTRSPPNIHPNYLDTEHDRQVAVDALRLARRLVLDSPSFRSKVSVCCSNSIFVFWSVLYHQNIIYILVNLTYILLFFMDSLFILFFFPSNTQYQPTEHFPGTHIDSDEDLAREAGNISTSIFHPVGTCKMGRSDDPTSVVDDRLRVIGVIGLRVVDASIMPTITSGNTNSPTIAIAEKASRMILSDNN